MHITHRLTGIATLAAAVAATLAVPPSSLLAARQKGAAAARNAPPAPQVAWPLPPEAPRIRYMQTYRGASDFKPAKTGGWRAMLLGPDDTASQPSDMLVKPYGVAVSDVGRIYVTDTAARRVFVFDPEARKVSFLGESGQGRLTKPTGIAVDRDGTVFVADATMNRVFAYRDGALVIAIGHEGELKAPSGLAIDRERKLLYVADSSIHQVLCYSTANGARVRTIGTRGSEPGEFNFPTNVVVDRRGQLYVADTLNFRIQVFDPNGRFLRAFGTQGDGPGTFNRPKGIAVDSEGHVYVVDTSFNNFQIFDPDGTLLLSVGAGGRETGEFQLPAGVYIDSRDRIYVADQGNSRVQAFQYLPVRNPYVGRTELWSAVQRSITAGGPKSGPPYVLSGGNSTHGTRSF